MKTTSNHVLGLLLVCGFAAASPVSGQVLFSDDFQTNSSTRWSVYGGGNNNVTNDYSVQWAFDYSAQTYRYNSQTLTVPAAPNSGGTRKGVKVTANKNRPSNPRIAAVSLYPKNVTFANNYALRFDMFMDYNGDIAGGGSGSTEFATFGINHQGNKVNWWSSQTTYFIGSSWPSDGVWFSVDGEGGTGNPPGDLQAYYGDPTPGPAVPLGAAAGFLYDQNIAYADPAAPLSLVLPVPPGQSWGAPGKQWVQVEIRQENGFVTWLMNGYVIASHNYLNGYESGTVMIGYSDPLSGVPNPINENYVIFDNVRVVDLTSAPATPTVRMTVMDADAAEPNNVASFVIDRVDKDGNPAPTTTPLTVNLKISGTASNGVDYVSIPTALTLPVGVQSTNINITPVNDGLGEPTESISIRLVSGTNYEMRTSFTGDFTLADDGDVTSASVQPIQSIGYENKRAASFNVFLSGSPSSSVVVNYAISGTASNGVDYVTIPASQTITAGNTNAVVLITPINNNVMSSNKTVTLRILPGSGYAVNPVSNATVTIRDDDLSPAAAVLFSDSFETDSSGSWNINKTQTSDIVTFAYDYSVDGIPAAPNSTNGTTKGVKLEANVSAAAAAGISLSPRNGNFTGDYRLRFDVWINYPGPLAGGSSDSYEFFSAGVGTKGTHTMWGSATNADGIWFDCNGDGSSTVAADFEAFRGRTSLLVGGADVWVGNSQASASPYYAEFGGLSAPQVQIDAGIGSDQSYRGSLGFAWHDMVVTKQGTNVSWTVDGLPFAVVPTNGATLSSNVFVGYYDPSSSVNANPQFAFVVVDNLRVESLSPPATPALGRIQKVGSNIQINFTAGAADVPSAFTLVGSSVLSESASAYTPVSGASITGSAGNFQATAPVSGNTMFYRIRR